MAFPFAYFLHTVGMQLRDIYGSLGDSLCPNSVEFLSSIMTYNYPFQLPRIKVVVIVIYMVDR